MSEGTISLHHEYGLFQATQRVLRRFAGICHSIMIRCCLRYGKSAGNEYADDAIRTARLQAGTQPVSGNRKG
jgi:hypothetical protein